MDSERLTYVPVDLDQVDAFHSLVVDAHVRCYLMDGNVFSREWTEERIRDSVTLFEQRGVGIWLARDEVSHELVGFCGFLVHAHQRPEPQLVYAMFERFTGRGLATEMACACIAEARKQRGFEEIVTGVDEGNWASLRVLEKLGFERIATFPGHFGETYMLRLRGEIAEHARRD